MLRLVFVAIAGWMLTGAAVALYDPIIGFFSAPFGGSLCAAAAAVISVRTSALSTEDDLVRQTDLMVANLQRLASQAHQIEGAEIVKKQVNSRVA